jgi:hypothetical protein
MACTRLTLIYRLPPDPNFLVVPDNFQVTLPPHKPGEKLPRSQPSFRANPQTVALSEKLGLPLPHESGGSDGAPGVMATRPQGLAGAGAPNPDEIDLEDEVEGNPDEINLAESDDQE